MRCPNCGAQNTDGAYCSNCGAALLTGDLPEAEQQLVRRNVSYYARRFAPMRSGKVLSWNWAAFFLGPLWLSYRKMTIPTLVSVFLLEGTFWFDKLWSAPLLMLLIGALGNWVYYRYVCFWSVVCATRPAEQLEQAFARRGGTSILGATATAALIIALALWWMRFFSHAAVLFSIRG